jgi:predicted P-loop ATPase
LDIDHVPSDALLAEYLDKIPYQRIIHASHSDRPDDRCVRVVVALTRPVPGNEWSKFWTNVVDHLQIPITKKNGANPNGGIDTQAKDASRLYFLPSRPSSACDIAVGDGTDYLFAHVDGPLLDVDAHLHDPHPHQEAPNVSHITNNFNSAVEGRTQALMELAQAWPPMGSRDEATMTLCGALAHLLWDEESIATFVQDLRDLIYPGGDPDPHKAKDQARRTIAKYSAGEKVNGWPSLAEYLQGGQDAVNRIRTHLQGDKQATKATTPKAPTLDMIEVDLKKARRKLLNAHGNTDSMLDGRMLKRILDHDQLQELDEDKQDSLDHAIRVLDKYTPTGTTDEQIAQLLGHVFPFDVGQGDLSWTDTLHRLVATVREKQAEEKSTNFEIALQGPNAGKPHNKEKNWDIAMKKLKARVAFDLFADREVLQIADLEAETIEDHHISWLRDRMARTFDLKPPKDEFYDYITVQARDNPYHAPREYFSTVEPKWDQTPRIERWLIDYCGAQDTPLTRAISRIVLIAAVRRVRKPGCKFDEMLILEGIQGTGKSTGLAALCPREEWFTDNLPLDGDTKMQMEVTGGKLIVEAAELVGKKKGDVDRLKSYLSRCVDSARMAYGRKNKRMPRQFIIIGTTNNAHYLRDPTGNRRFWPVSIMYVDTKALTQDCEQLWAEAAHCETQGESIRLDPSLYNAAAEEQEQRRVVDPFEIILEEVFANKVGRIKSTDVWQVLGKDAADAKPEEQVRMGDAMRRLGWAWGRPRIKGTRIPHYMKGTPAEQEVTLVVSGRKVMQAATNLPSPPAVIKVN